MAEYRLTVKADKDVHEIAADLAIVSLPAADKLLDAFEQHFLMLAENRHFGRARPEIAPDMRYSLVKKYLIFYRPIPEGVEIVRVVHGRRNIQALIDADEF